MLPIAVGYADRISKDQSLVEKLTIPIRVRRHYQPAVDHRYFLGEAQVTGVVTRQEVSARIAGSDQILQASWQYSS